MQAARSHVVVVAAGVSTTTGLELTQYERENALVRETIRRCRVKGRQLVFFSTASAGMYGAEGCRGVEDDAVTPISPFGEHKLRLEQEVRGSGVRHLVLRLGHVVGPGQRGHQLVPTLVRQLKSGRMTVYRGTRRDILAVADFVTLVEGLLSRGVEGQVVNIGSGYDVPVDRIIDHLEGRLGTTARRDYLDGARSSCTLSMDKLRRLVPAYDTLGFGPEYYRTAIDSYLEG
ncbi:NAD-dependent epimerase/dehydratase family protein [Streptomyces sp. NPDC046976]|uniref:NAD-dependent epimerase/dehydratase family protein n=1 Tax=Streptomyces sp. NPDC046976 TaxID=3155258 RepID=UPI0033EE9042